MDVRGEVAVVAEDVQVAAKPRRRTYTAEYKRRILKEADACTTPGAVGALLRREGLYSSLLVEWRRARGRVPPRVVSYFGSIATSGSRFLGSGLSVPGGTRVISSTTLSLNGVGIPTWRPCSET